MLQHGINVFKQDTAATGVTATAVGIPFFIGAAPCFAGKGYAGKPQYITSFAEARETLGYSAEWRNGEGKPKWSLCQAMYAHLVLNAMSPAIFYNVFNPEKHKTDAVSESFTAANHIITLPKDALYNGALTVAVESSEMQLVDGVDYEAYYTDEGLCVEFLEDGAGYAAEQATVSYETANPDMITAEDIELAVEAVEMCRSSVGIVPDLLCAPGWSSNPAVAAVLAAKAPSINGLFRAKAVVDLDTSDDGADDYSKVLEVKSKNGYSSEDMIVCWPMVKSGNYLFDMSAVVCGVIAKLDNENGGCPYESPSNKAAPITGAVNAKGEEISITIPQADILSVTDGVVTVINNGSWTLWGNYLGCYPTNSDVAKIFICTNRVQDWLCNTFINNYWSYIDKPLKPVIRDALVNSFNSWLNGLTAEGKLYGGEITYNPEYNPAGELINGKITLNAAAASPVPMQRVDLNVEYSVDMLEAAMNG